MRQIYLTVYLYSADLLPELQSAWYRSHHSTETAVLKVLLKKEVNFEIYIADRKATTCI